MTKRIGVFFHMFFFLTGVALAQQPENYITDSTHDGSVISSVGFSTEPYMVSEGPLEISPRLLKKGASGTVAVDVEIDEAGKIGNCSITQSLSPFMDSTVLASVSHSLFSPAIENGKAVPSTIALQVRFSLDSMVAKSGTVSPAIEGTVLDGMTQRPLVGAIVNIQFIDSTSDTDISCGFTRYLEMIGTVPGQKYKSGTLSTNADSAGRFSFRLLPNCPAVISVQSQGHEIAHFKECPRTGNRTIVRYYLTRISNDPTIIDSLNEIKVYGFRKNNIINVERQEIASGLTHYMSKLLLTQSAVRQIPEAGSAQQVRSSSPYDNRYILAGVPFLSPFHFGGYPYADIDGMMISALKDITVSIDRIAGRRIDVSGALIETNPGVYRPADRKLVKRPELAVDFSMMGPDMLLSVPAGKGDNDYFQVGCTGSDSYQLKVLYGYYGMNNASALDFGQPQSFGNLTITDKKTVDSLQFDSFAWLAYDRYSAKNVPWGMASVRMHPRDDDNLSLLGGGSRQYFVKGKRVGNNAFLRTAYLSNGVVEGKIDTLANDFADINLDCRIDYQDWHGSVIQRDPAGIDTSYHAEGEETGAHIHGCLNKEIGPVMASADLLCSGILYGKKPDAVFDGGISLIWALRNLRTELHAGRVTSRPDIRGLPDPSFRSRQIHTYLLATPIIVRITPFVKIGIQPYLRFQDQCPKMDPMLNIWDKTASTTLRAKGIDMDVELQPLHWITFYGVANLADAERVDGKNQALYEWNIPWTIRSGSRLSLMSDRFYLYVDYILTKGLPYYDFNAKNYLMMPDYGRMDLSLQYRAPIRPHRFITRYDGYINISNVLDRVNIRDYYWDRDMNRRGIFLGPLFSDIGLRVGFRL